MMVYVVFVPVINGWETEEFIGVYPTRTQAELVAQKQEDNDKYVKIAEVEFYNEEEV